MSDMLKQAVRRRPAGHYIWTCASPNYWRPARMLRVAMALCAGVALSSGQNPTATDLAQTSLEDLMNIQVTSVSKKARNWPRRVPRFS